MNNHNLLWYPYSEWVIPGVALRDCSHYEIMNIMLTYVFVNVNAFVNT